VNEQDNSPVFSGNPSSAQMSVGDEILKLLNERTNNPGEAFILLQQLGVYVWDQYKIDWTEKEGQKVSSSRKQRYMDFVSDLIDTLKANNVLSEKDE
jgi:hypothetical protein